VARTVAWFRIAAGAEEHTAVFRAMEQGDAAGAVPPCKSASAIAAQIDRLRREPRMVRTTRANETHSSIGE
jgi:hypothetical protein